MATHQTPIQMLQPIDVGVVWESSAVSGSNDRYPVPVLAYTSQSAKQSCTYLFRVPLNYVGTPAITGVVYTTATTGVAQMDVDGTAVADSESLDPSADQFTGTTNVTLPGTARQRASFTISLTASDFVAGDLVMGRLYRDGADAADTLAATLYLPNSVMFSYTDV